MCPEYVRIFVRIPEIQVYIPVHIEVEREGVRRLLDLNYTLSCFLVDPLQPILNLCNRHSIRSLQAKKLNAKTSSIPEWDEISLTLL